MTIQGALLGAIKKLSGTHSTSAHLDAEVLLSFILKKPRGYLLAHPGRTVSAAHYRHFSKLIGQRRRGMPVAYLTGSKEFYKLDFVVTKDTLIPRPETELLVEQAIQAVRERRRQHPEQKKVAVADIGTGSGCIAVTLAKYLPNVHMYAIDSSPKALVVAKKNARLHHVAKTVSFLQGNLLKPLCTKKKGVKRLPVPGVIVANLPYLTTDELHGVPFEPRQALYGGKLGLELIERLLMQSAEAMPVDTMIVLEIAPTQAKAIDYMAGQYLPLKKVSFIKDLAGRDRVAVIR
ncbi:MAG: peptide chain release factor N(5)-glutamine methyltransferase [Patescibacteria group bacterium]